MAAAVYVAMWLSDAVAQLLSASLILACTTVSVAYYEA